MLIQRLTLWILVAVAVTALSMALVAEHVFKLDPCILCLYQRLPYVATGLLALLALKLPANSPVVAWIVGLCALVFLAGASVAVYHIGVEQHWWISSCTGAQADQISFEQMKSALNSKPAKSCDDVDWTLFGISMATYNAAFSIAMTVASLIAARLIWKNNDTNKPRP